MHVAVLEVETGERLVTDLSHEIRSFCRDLGDGLCHVFVPHATAGIALMETGAGSEEDLRRVIERLAPPDDRYVHRHGSPGHGVDHVLPVFISPSLVLAVQGGEPVLGTWQSVVLVDTNVDNRHRRVQLSFLADAST